MPADLPGAAGPPGGGLMSVHTDLVREHLVGSLLSASFARLADGVPVGAEEAIASQGGDEVDRNLARLGYLGRTIEWERFEPARRPMPWLAELLREHAAAGNAGPSAAVAVSRELASGEPGARPRPDSGAASWRVPGPGGHVRHYLALGAVEGQLADPGTTAEAELVALKQSWFFGFYLRCCEER